jgi:hypothetical protein
MTSKFNELVKKMSVLSEEMSDGRYELGPEGHDERFNLFADIFPSYVEGKEELLRAIYDAIFSGKIASFSDREGILKAIGEHKRTF